MTYASQLRTFVLSALLILGLAGQSNAATLAGDFNTSTNPGSGWTNGFNDIGVGGGNDVANDITFALFHPRNEGNAGDRWTGDGTTNTNYPPNDSMLVNLGSGNTEANHWGGGSITWTSGVAYHTWGNTTLSGGINGLSADDTIFSTYTIPATGNYDITGKWTENGNSGGANVTILVNGSSIGTGAIDLDVPGSTATIQTLGAHLSLGDTVSFRTTRQTDYSFGGSARADFSVIPLQPISLEVFVNRQTGAVTLQNNTSSAVNIVGYSIESASGALNPALWTSYADSDSSWHELSTTDSELSEATLGSKTLSTPSTRNLGNVWRRMPNNEDVQVTVALANETVVTLPVEYTGLDLSVGDLDFDGDVDSSDWIKFRMGQGVDMAGLSLFQSYALGDLDGDLDNDTTDFRIFKDAFLLQQGGMSAAELGIQTPEPSAFSLMLMLVAWSCPSRRRASRG